MNKELFVLLFVGLNLIIGTKSFCQLGYYDSGNGDCKSCPTNCQICRVENSTLACYSCEEGYRVNIDTMKCVRCIENCAQCSREDGRCQFCIENYLYNFDADRCEEQKRDSNGVVECIKGYYNHAGLCVKCGAFCLECDDYGTCTSCEDGFYVGIYEAYYVHQVQCMLCQLPCKTCSSASECVEEYDTKDLYTNTSGRGKCDEGQFESQGNGKCIPCGKGCTDCNKYGVCLQCQTPYYLTDDKQDFPLPYCKPCEPGTQCAQEGSQQSEDNCGVGYFQSLTDDSCVPCGYACMHCTRTGYCIQCQEGYVLNSEYFCVTEEYEKQIQENPCQDGQYSDPVTSVCKDCKEGCSLCHGWNICDECFSGFHLAGSDNKCYNITQYKQNQNQVNCYQHFYKLNNQCLPCDNNCDVCNKDHCLACKKGFNLDYSDWQCKSDSSDSDDGDHQNKCTNGCAECLNMFACSKCKPGFYYSGALCYACPASCPNCLNYEICSEEQQQQSQEQSQDQQQVEPTQCAVGSYLTSSGYCLSCLDNCLKCSNQTICQECENGYELDSSKCKKSCDVGQYRNYYGNCQSCPSRCSSCISNQQCTSCVPGYALDSSKCVEFSCPMGSFKNSNGQCESCGPNCQSCQNGDTCLKCEPTYFATDSGFCWKCGAICRTCSSGGDCTHEQYSPSGDGCPSGKFLNSYGNCYDCRYGCDRCADALTCEVCQKGYYLDEDSCNPCPYGCNQCGAGGVCQDKQEESSSSQTDYSTVVSPCGHGRYQGYMGVCYQCGFGCDYCDQSAKCHRCYSGYYMNYGFCYKCLYPCATCSSMTQCLSYMTDIEYEQSKVWLYVIFGIIGVGLLLIAYLIWKRRSQESNKQSKLLGESIQTMEMQRQNISL